MQNKRDYYEILGISKSASQDEVKNAYRNLARKHHPDMAAPTDKAEAERRFKEINEAYQVLGDAQKRKSYDQFGHAGAGFGSGDSRGFGGFGSQYGPFTYSYTSGAGGDFEGFDPFDIFEQAFGFRGFGGSRGPRKGKNLYYELNVDFADAVRGAEKVVSVESGKVTIKIPAGVRNGTELRFEGRGLPGPNGMSPGDLYITARVTTPAHFQRADDDLATAIELDFAQAALGAVVEVPVVDATSHTGVGTAKLKIPAGTQPGTQFRLKAKGMPKLRGAGVGDVFVSVFVKIPKKLSREQKRLLEEYGRL
ncbi:MAG: Chaperone protein DnaJ [candidate division WWE3 bacterium GW2011_GWA1_46_21]|uniref:Chaperone protein DnaJ n=1 Tax=candidate division WWE3 bacterium GW2011_GWA1_46_21 TaxID=1619107 RepID=A0A0G1RPT6_UNCKA|nr:MAG: Chaperone protein DnaJ [candidate division WWE3 bacterium GW2011_GWA1_46_21]